METERQPEKSTRPQSEDKGYRVLAAAEASGDFVQEFAAAVMEGLAEKPKRLSSRFIYDDAGSEYFRQIMALEEYYPTRCEAEILREQGSAIAERFAGVNLNVVDLGAGDGAKTMLLLRHFAAAGVPCSYVPIDISEGAMAGLAGFARREVPTLGVAGLVADYWTALRWLNDNSQGQRNLVLFLGSNIGNFDKANARNFLRRLWTALRPDDYVFIGFDLKKDIDKLLAAYNDSKGVTARFNKNLLARINNELGGHFDLDKFRHYATYDVFSGAMESYLVSLVEQTVQVDALDREFRFDEWEPMHTEYSYKYLQQDIEGLAAHTGFVIEDAYYDSNRWYCGSLWRVEKGLA